MSSQPQMDKAAKKAAKAARRAKQKGLDQTSHNQHNQHNQHAPQNDKDSGQLNNHLHSNMISNSSNLPNISRSAVLGHLDIPQIVDIPEISDIHPAIRSLASKFASYSIVGSTSRCRHTLLAFKLVVNDYVTPHGTTLSRNLTTHLSKQIDFLKSARPLSVSMGSAIRWLKQIIANTSIDLQDDEAKLNIINEIDIFIRDKIDVADALIIRSAIKHINNNDVVLVYAYSDVVAKSLLSAHQAGISFRVIVINSRPLNEGKRLVDQLAAAGIKATFTYISGLRYVISEANVVFLGAHAMLTNGHLYSRVGTALVAMAAHSQNLPVIVCCESIKFTDRVQLDSLTMNELGNPDMLADNTAMKDWNLSPGLSAINIMYDLTPAAFIKKIVTEFGNLPPTSVPVILREYKSITS